MAVLSNFPLVLFVKLVNRGGDAVLPLGKCQGGMQKYMLVCHKSTQLLTQSVT